MKNIKSALLNFTRSHILCRATRPSLRIVLLPLILLSLVQCSHLRLDQKAPETESKRVSIKKENFGGLFDVHIIELKNGLVAYVIEDDSSPTFAIQTWFHVGSKDEVKGYTGLAHLFEHMMFKGTQTVPEGQFDKILEQEGSEGLNAFTTNDVTVYVQEMPKESLELILKLESDRMVNLVVNEASFSTEREVVQNERRFRKENSPEGTMYQRLFEVAFTKHPYRWPVIGYEEDLTRMKAQDAYSFYKRYYAPNNARILISGDVSASKVAELLDTYYGELNSVQIERPKDIVFDSPRVTPKTDILKLNIKTEILYVAFNVPSVTHNDALALSFLETLWCGGKSARINQVLVESGIASGASCGTLDLEHPSLFLFHVNLQKGRTTADAEKVILNEISRAKQKGFSKEEWTRALNQIQFGFYSGLETNKERIHFFGRNIILYKDLNKIYGLYEKLLQTQNEDVQKALNQYFKSSQRVTIIGRPK